MESAVLIVIVVALVGVISTVLGTQGNRLKHVEDRLSSVQTDNRRLWLHNRSLIDYIYRWSVEDAPELPKPPRLTEDEE